MKSLKELLKDVNLKRIESVNEEISVTAEELAKELEEPEEEDWYVYLLSETTPSFLFECLSITKDAKKRGVIKTSPGKYFTGVVKRRLSSIIKRGH